MKIHFSKIHTTPYPFKLNLENIVFEGDMVKINAKIVKINVIIKGFIYKPCDSCGEETEFSINEKLELFASDGIFKDSENELSNTIEFFDSQIDLIEIAIGEVETYFSDYFYCDKCKI